jgi:hypothetical protein
MHYLQQVASTNMGLSSMVQRMLQIQLCRFSFADPGLQIQGFKTSFSNSGLSSRFQIQVSAPGFTFRFDQ